jgi:hypothetical protein
MIRNIQRLSNQYIREYLDEVFADNKISREKLLFRRVTLRPRLLFLRNGSNVSPIPVRLE